MFFGALGPSCFVGPWNIHLFFSFYHLSPNWFKKSCIYLHSFLHFSPSEATNFKHCMHFKCLPYGLCSDISEHFFCIFRIRLYLIFLTVVFRTSLYLLFDSFSIPHSFSESTFACHKVLGKGKGGKDSKIIHWDLVIFSVLLTIWLKFGNSLYWSSANWVFCNFIFLFLLFSIGFGGNKLWETWT